jgi:hypothetical protein
MAQGASLRVRKWSEKASQLALFSIFWRVRKTERGPGVIFAGSVILES